MTNPLIFPTLSSRSHLSTCDIRFNNCIFTQHF